MEGKMEPYFFQLHYHITSFASFFVTPNPIIKQQIQPR